MNALKRAFKPLRPESKRESIAGENAADTEISKPTVVRHPITKPKLWWRERTTLERTLLVSLVIAVLGIIIITFLLIYRHLNRYRVLCLTPECVDEARYLLSSMNESADPCQDFYQFACGNAANQYNPKDKPVINVFTDVERSVLDQIVPFLGEPTLDTDTNPTRIAKSVYDLCTDIGQTNLLGLEALNKHLTTFGGWPVVTGASWASTWTWTKIIHKLRESGLFFQSLMQVVVYADPGSSKNIIGIDVPLFSRREPFLQSQSSDYLDYMVNIAVLMGADPATAKTELQEVVKFESELEKASLGATTEGRKVTVKYLIDHFPSIPWLEVITNVLLTDTPIQAAEQLAVIGIEYFKKIESILSTATERVKANYLVWKAIERVVPYLPETFQPSRAKFEISVGISIGKPSRGRDCASDLRDSLPIAVASEYLKRYGREELKEKATALVTEMKAEFLNTLSGVTFMDEATRTTVHDKYSEMGESVAYPDELLDNSKVAAAYETMAVDVNGTTYLDVHLIITKFYTTFYYKRLRGQYVKWDWNNFAKIFDIDLEYLHTNIIRAPIGILQGHIYSENRPNYLNFGALGWLLGSELTIAFIDDSKWEADPDGSGEANEKAKCFIDQYSKYKVESIDLPVDGTRTFKQNFADNGGLIIAYNAYQNWLSDNSAEQFLPGFHEYSGNKMFWVSAAALLCTAYRAEQMKSIIDSSLFSPGKFRVMGSFSNSKEFAKDFGCEAETPMNPTEKCVVWS